MQNKLTEQHASDCYTGTVYVDHWARLPQLLADCRRSWAWFVLCRTLTPYHVMVCSLVCKLGIWRLQWHAVWKAQLQHEYARKYEQLIAICNMWALDNLQHAHHWELIQPGKQSLEQEWGPYHVLSNILGVQQGIILFFIWRYIDWQLQHE